MSNTAALARAQVNTAGNITIGHYVLGKALGKGTFGQVKQGTHVLTGEKVAVKILEKDKINDQKDVERITREIKILKKVRHPNVIQLYEIIETEKELFMIMENANGGELFDYIVRHTRLQEAKAAKLYCELVAGIEYLHKSGVCHRDLKPENLLLDYDNTLKIVDFGLSNLYEKGQTLKTACGSPCYAAPEMIAGKRYHGLQSDIWSSGVVFYAMVAGYLPFEDPKTSNLYKKIMSADYQMPKFLSSECKDFITKILNTDPTHRYTIQDIRSHPYMKNQMKRDMMDTTKEPGLFPGLQKMPFERDFLSKLIEDYSFEEEYSIRCMEANRHNHITATYHLLKKKQQRNSYMRETFGTHRSKGQDDAARRERLQSQGAPAARTIDASHQRPAPRKVIEDELNQTMPISVKKTSDKAKANDLILAPPKTRDGHSEVPKDKRAFNTIDLGDSTAGSSVRGPRVADRNGPVIGGIPQNQIEMIKSRVTKQSVSPDKYQINSNLVVHLGDPIKKADPRKIQTQYKPAPAKASFFPSTATATTGASSGTGSQDPRRTSDAGSRQIGGTIDYARSNAAQMNQTHQAEHSGTNELGNLPMRLGKKQIRLNNNVGHTNGSNTSTHGNAVAGYRRPSNVDGTMNQATKNAWQSIELNQIKSGSQPQTATSNMGPQNIFNSKNSSRHPNGGVGPGSVNKSTKLQYQLCKLPDTTKTVIHGRNSPRGSHDATGNTHPGAVAVDIQRKNQFYNAIQVKSMMGGNNSPTSDKKSILTKLFKGQQPQPTYNTVNSSFNEQLAQTNYGFNPQRQTLVQGDHYERHLVTQKRPRGGHSLVEEAQLRGSSLHQHDGQGHPTGYHPQHQAHGYHGSPQNGGKPNSQGVGAPTSIRVNPHQRGTSQEAADSNTKQLFLPATMKANNQGQRKALNTQHQTYRAHSYGAGPGHQAPVSP